MWKLLYLLLLSLPSHMALFDAPVAKEVPEVSENGEDAIAHVGEHGDQQGCLLKGFQEGLFVQAGVDGHILVLEDRKVRKSEVRHY